jgi:lysyl-tRNA synthetase class II
MDTKDLNKIQKDREEKLKKLRDAGFNFPNDFEKKDNLGDVAEQFSNETKIDLEQKVVSVQSAGRIIFVSLLNCSATSPKLSFFSKSLGKLKPASLSFFSFSSLSF